MNNYEKKYKEALERMKSWARGEHPECFTEAQKAAEFIFPELKEDEDERIRKGLIKAFGSIGKKEWGGVNVKNAIAWLEKQGRHANFRNKIQIGDKVTRNEDGVLVNLSQLNRVAEKNEKQGENHDDKYNITGIKSKHAEGKLGEMIKEIKSTDKVEPKFKAGDWIVRELDNSVHQVKAVIENISNGKYGYDLTKGGYISSQDANFYHLWTIEDAKDGDVLVASDGSIFLFKGTIDCACKHYVALTTDNVVKFNEGLEHYWETSTAVHPATKEQRDQLEKAMSDAGYAFDFEREEFKKIEDEIEIPFGAKDSELIEESYYIPKGFHAEIDEDKVVIKKGEKPTAWSEEDENIKEWIMSDINKLLALNRKSFVIADKELNWLKSLKDRSAWMASWEQLDALEYHLKHTNENSRLYKETKKLYDQLKKLK